MKRPIVLRDTKLSQPLALRLWKDGSAISVGRRYGIAFFAIVAAFTFRLVLTPLLQGLAPFVMFLPAIIISAWFGGKRVAFCASVASGLLAHYFFIVPFNTTALADISLIIAVPTYLVSALLVVGMINALRKHDVLLEKEIEERIRLEQELRLSEERFRRIFEVADVGIVQVDPCGSIRHVNPKFCQIVGYSLHELQRRKISELLEPEDRPLDAACLDDLAAGRIPACTRDKRYIHKSGKTIWVRLTATYLHDGQGKPEMSVSVVEDITAQVQAAAELQKAKDQIALHAQELEDRVVERTQALQTSLRDTENLCYTIAHDLRAPLRAIRGFSIALVDDYEAVLDEAGHDYCNRICAAASRMDQLISDLLQFGRIMHSPFSLQPLDLAAELERTLSLAGEEILRSHAEVVVKKPLPMICAASTLLDQVLRNFVNNALKFVPPNVSPQIEIYAESHENKVRICVKDSGIGIALEYQQKIFGPFQRLHNCDRYPGTGMGLAIAQKAAEKMHGTVGVESILGNGSRFWVELPYPQKCRLSRTVGGCSCTV